MNYLKKLFSQPLPEIRTRAVLVVLVIALLGFADAGFLTFEHYRGVVPPCGIESGCEKVLTSEYSFIAGIPVSLLGAIYYFLIALGAFVYLESRHGAGAVAAHHSQILKWTLLATTAGLIMSLWFLYVQAFVLHSYCLYCLGSAATSIALFITANIILWKSQKLTQIS